MNAMTPQMQASWRKMVGTAFLWVALASAFGASTNTAGKGALSAVIGFASFAVGLALFSDGMKREIVEEVRGGLKKN